MISGRPSRSGFSLIELMIAIVIIGVMAAAVGPSLTEVLADTRQASAAQDVVQLSRRTRALALGSGVAHMLRFLEGGSGGLGTIEIYSGMNGKCMQTSWSQAVQAPIDNTPAARLGALDALNMAYYNPTTSGVSPGFTDAGRQVISLRMFIGAANASTAVMCICYQPNGDAYTMTNNDQLNPVFARQAAFLRFVVHRAIDGVTHGTDREVIFPVGGSARQK